MMATASRSFSLIHEAASAGVSLHVHFKSHTSHSIWYLLASSLTTHVLPLTPTAFTSSQSSERPSLHLMSPCHLKSFDVSLTHTLNVSRDTSADRGFSIEVAECVGIFKVLGM
ncbi:hypothetical protein DPEC_G00302010 [Dallia pectoralis]|uniref:Uncharacterized protein n=1 Tax=Dallia pectoralis TaxID=75939 RepID=A0ACC2FGM7_DALPE|nr:hypothetical protein DPEC_G00302010 [Dallia pectoralis]